MSTTTPTVSTNRYQWAHGKQPRGTGDWAFFFDGDTVPFWVVGVPYSEAKRHAQTVARERGVTRVEVGS